MTVTIASFIKGKMHIVIHKSDRNIGARGMDYELVEKLGEEFTKKYGADPRKNIRARLRMLDIIEKQRKILSGNKEATIHLEALLEDEDLHKNLKREEFEELINPMIDKFTEVLKEALEQSGKCQSWPHMQIRVELAPINGQALSYSCYIDLMKALTIATFRTSDHSYTERVV
jgi:heat shock protein 4